MKVAQSNVLVNYTDAAKPLKKLAGAELPALTTEAAPEAPAKAPKKRSAVPEA